MKVSDLKPEEVYIGMRIMTATGKFAKIVKYVWSNANPNDTIINDCINANDDYTAIFKIDGEDFEPGHAFYLHQGDKLTVLSLNHHIWCGHYLQKISKCLTCKDLWSKYPYDPENIGDLVAKYFPDGMKDRHPSNEWDRV